LKKDFGINKGIDMVLSAYRSIRSPVAYVSTPITSGRLLYDVLEKEGVRSIAELNREQVLHEIVKPNIARGISLADKLRERSKLPPLAPGVFEGRDFKWTQQDYMSLWVRVIEELAGEVHMTEGWQFSDGAVEEFTLAMHMRYGFLPNLDFKRAQSLSKEEYRRVRSMQIYDHTGAPMMIDCGTGMINDAIDELIEKGFGCTRMILALRELGNIGGAYQDQLMEFEEWDRRYRSHPEDHNRIDWNRLHDLMMKADDLKERLGIEGWMQLGE
jgi:hypothetical protein